MASPSAANESPDQEALIATAYEYGFPLFEEARLSYFFSYDPANPKRVPVNTFGHHRQLADATDRTVTTPNNDTLYSSAIIDLATGPIRLEVPDFGSRYFSIAFIDPYTNNFAYLGTRANGGSGGSYLLVGPSWRGPPPDAMRVIRAPYNHIIALARILIDGPGDYSTVHGLQDALTLRPATPAPPRSDLVAPSSSQADVFVAVVNQVLHDNPPPSYDAPLLRDLKAVGIGPNAGPLTFEQRKQWDDHIAAARARLLTESKRIGTRIQGWDYPPSDIGDFGMDYHTRAEVALRGIGANVPLEMAYAVASVDRNGDILDGGRNYRLHLPAGTPPARGFWSISIYETTRDGRLFFGDNPIQRYSIGDRTSGLVRNADGSLDIFIQINRPGDYRTANWLPIPAKDFVVIARAYLPQMEMLNGQFHYSGLEPVRREADSQ